MTVVVTDNCDGCRFTDCTKVCPVECFHFDDRMLYIDPELCIDCNACIAECPVQAIYEEHRLPEDKRHWILVNAERSHELPVVTAPMDPLPGAEQRRSQLGF